MYRIELTDDQLLTLHGALCVQAESLRVRHQKRPDSWTNAQLEKCAALLDYLVEVQGGAPLTAL